MPAWLLKIQASSFIHNEVIGDRKWPELLRERWYGRAADLLDLAGALPCPQMNPIFSYNTELLLNTRLPWHTALLLSLNSLPSAQY
jgi:hypothetical protein